MIKENFVKLYETSLREYWSLPALTNYKSGTTYSYADMAKWIAKVHLMLEHLGVQTGDKVAIVAKDSSEWCMSYLGIVTYGAVIVPILPDFHPDDIHNIINHSDSAVVFSADTHLTQLRSEALPAVHTVIDINTLAVVHELTKGETFEVESLFAARYPNGFAKENIQYKEISNDTVMLINYTSGTTGFSKGVIITANNLAGNVTFGINKHIIVKGGKMLSFLPNAHAYGCAFNFLLPLAVGAHVYMLGSIPTPTVLVKAFADVRPDLIISVPLILEKIYKNVIAPTLSKPVMKVMLSLPILRGVIYKKVRQKLIDTMGGNFKTTIIGGAAMNEEVTMFLHKIKFPYTIGYGMTECAPLISYEDHRKYVPLSCGKILPGTMEIRIAEVPESHEVGVGEIQVRGEHVCKGYYKNAEATEALFTADGWLRTGDLASIDKHGNIFIKGRSKSMLLGPSGQNIYPEELEAKLNMLPGIAESLVLQRKDHQLVALVYLDPATLTAQNINTPEEINALLARNKETINKQVAAYERIAEFRLMEEEFQKTPKRSIKRFLYSID